MFKPIPKPRRKILLLLFAFFISYQGSTQTNPWNGKVIIQGFWWDYWNHNYPFNWSGYLTDLSPRLRDLGIDGVWIPPTIKNAKSSYVGYGPFDAYDLGDKFQKGELTTRVGTKDNLLKMVGVMHSNGLDVIQDIILNHCNDAGSAINGAGGQDTAAMDDGVTRKYKNFRYVSFSTPALNEGDTNYLSRNGRWPKNWQNFYPNKFNTVNTNEINSVKFGPDISYEDNAYGKSSNAFYNPDQSPSYMRNEARRWMVWYKKQVGFDGIRLDAAKHFPSWLTQDVLWNIKYNAGFANGGANMFAVGEFIGDASQMDGWINDVKYSNGGSEDLTGTFDFSLRSAIKDMISGGGFYDLGSIPSKQQGNRFRTVPFVNNHDTYRPIVDSVGNIKGWDVGNELGGGHIDPNDCRLAVAYAITFAVDGSPQVFMEDLFKFGSGNRFSHKPSNATDLPIRDEIANIIWCHQKLNFKKGSYKVRVQKPDCLIIERGNSGGAEKSYAIIGVNDNWNTWQKENIQTDFGPFQQLHDYSGANASDVWTDKDGKVDIWIPPCDGSNKRRGYTIWGPAGITGGFNPDQRSTTQEWEMADDLGDSHPNSLKQGGAIPANSVTERYVGKIYAQSGKLITIECYPDSANVSLTMILYDTLNNKLGDVSGKGYRKLTFTPTYDGNFKIKIKNTSATGSPKQRVFVKVNYTAPRSAVTIMPIAYTSTYSKKNIDKNTVISETIKDALLSPNPAEQYFTLSFLSDHDTKKIQINIINNAGIICKAIQENVMNGINKIRIDRGSLLPGTYQLQIMDDNKRTITKQLVLL